MKLRKPLTANERGPAVPPTVRREEGRPWRTTTTRPRKGYLKSRDFPIHLMAGWWVFWLATSYTNLNEFIPPSIVTLGQFAMLVVSFLVGHYSIKALRPNALRSPVVKARTSIQLGSPRLRIALSVAALLCTIILFASLVLSGAFSSSFIEYFTKLRMDESSLESLTGIRSLDVLSKILAFPLSYTVILVVLADESKRSILILLLCILNLLAFCYLWQINYPLIHLFWFLIFHSLVKVRRHGAFDTRTAVIVLVVFTTLLMSAANRFGGDIMGGLQRYIFGYHLIGFSFYDHQYLNPNSILHTHSFGRTSLGFLDQMLEAVSKIIGGGYKAASFENSTFNSEAIDIGRMEIKEFNAFGTILFGLYRDFHFIGIFLGGFAYGALTTQALRRCSGSWFSSALFLLLASSWMMGMMVNPVEQAYFWFAVAALSLLRLVSRGVHSRFSSAPASKGTKNAVQ